MDIIEEFIEIKRWHLTKQKNLKKMLLSTCKYFFCKLLYALYFYVGELSRGGRTNVALGTAALLKSFIFPWPSHDFFLVSRAVKYDVTVPTLTWFGQIARFGHDSARWLNPVPKALQFGVNFNVGFWHVKTFLDPKSRHMVWG